MLEVREGNTSPAHSEELDNVSHGQDEETSTGVGDDNDELSAANEAITASSDDLNKGECDPIRNQSEKRKGLNKKKSKKKKKEKNGKKEKKKKNGNRNKKETSTDDSSSVIFGRQECLDNDADGTNVDIDGGNGTTVDEGTHTPSGTSVLTDNDDDDNDAKNCSVTMSSMPSLREVERARSIRDNSLHNDCDSDDDRLWSGLDKRERDRKHSKAERKQSKAEKKRISKNKKRMRLKSEWESSVAAEDASDARINLDEDSESQAPGSTLSLHSMGDSYRNRSANSSRSISFRSLKTERNASVLRSIKGEDSDNITSKPSAIQKSPSRQDLRKDLEAQVEERVESSRVSQKGEMLTIIKQSSRRLSGAFELDEGGCDFNSKDGDEESKNSDDNENKKEKDGDGEEDVKQKSELWGKKWLFWKEILFTRKGYIMLVLVLIFLFVVCNIILIAFLTT